VGVWRTQVLVNASTPTVPISNLPLASHSVAQQIWDKASLQLSLYGGFSRSIGVARKVAYHVGYTSSLGVAQPQDVIRRGVAPTIYWDDGLNVVFLDA
jgi:hypothetical protein